MNRKRRIASIGGRALLPVIVLIGSMLLTACDEADWDLLLDWGGDWAASNHVWDGESLDMGNLVRLGAEQQVNAIFDPNPALNAGEVARDIQKADDLAQQASLATQLGEPDEAMTALNTAIQLRPNDYNYVQQRAAASLANGDTAGYERDLEKATRLMEAQVGRTQSVEQCHRLYRQFYQHQLDVLNQAYGMACSVHGQCDYIADQQVYYTNGLNNADQSPCD